MSKTARDVITKTLQVLRVTAIEDEPDADTYQTALDTYQVWHNELQADIRDKYRLTRRAWDHDNVPETIWMNVAIAFAERLMVMVPVSQEVEAKTPRNSSDALGGLYKILAKRKNSFDRYDEALSRKYKYYDNNYYGFDFS